MNPDGSQRSPFVALFLGGALAKVDKSRDLLPITLGALAFDAMPLRVREPGLVVRNIGQSSPYPGEVNTLSVTLASNVDLLGAGASQITIAGLESAV